MTKIYLIRHGEAEGNVFRRFHGQYDAPLTANGHAQVKALEKRFRDIPVDACFSSDLIRTSLTARAIYLPKGLPLHRDPAFREVGVGILEDVPFGYVEHFHPGMMQNFDGDPATWQIEGGETYPQFTGRFLRRLRELAEEYEGKTIAIFTHGAVLRCSLAALLYTPAEAGKIPYCDNTAVTELTYEAGTFALGFYGDAGHLPENLATRGSELRKKQKKLGGSLWYAPAEGNEEILTALGADAAACQALAAGEEEAFVLAMRGSVPIGYVALNPRAGRLEKLCLLPEYRGIWLEDQLLGHAVSFMRKHGFEELRAREIPGSDVLKRYGFALCGEEFVLNIDTGKYLWGPVPETA